MLIIIGIFILGLFFGSFASVLITRFSGEYDWKTVKSVLRGRSQCPQCKTSLTAKNLIPLVSWLCQKWKCDKCWKKIPSFYPWIELISGIVFVLTYYFFPHDFQLADLIFWLFVNRSLMILIVSDLKYYELNMPIYMLLTVGILFYYASPITYPTRVWGVFQHAILCWILFFLAYLGIYYFARRYAKKREIWIDGEGFGFGDVLFAGIAWILLAEIQDPMIFYNNISAIFQVLLVYTILSCILGIVYYFISLLIFPKQKALIPFLPAMIVALWIIVLYPQILTLFIHI